MHEKRQSLELVMDRRLLVSSICTFDQGLTLVCEIVVNESSFSILSS